MAGPGPAAIRPILQFGNGNNGIMTYRPKLAPRLAAGIGHGAAGEDLDDDHAPATAGHGHGRTGAVRPGFPEVACPRPRRRQNGEQRAGLGDVPLAAAIGQKP